MEPATLLLLFGLLACPIAMGVMMWMMNKNMSGQQSHSMPDDSSEPDQLQRLREQQRLLELEIAELEKIAALNERKEALAQAPGNPPDRLPRTVEGSRN